MGKIQNKNGKSMQAIKSTSFSDTINKYARGSLKDVKLNKIKFKGLRKTMKKTVETIKDTATKNAGAEVLLPSEAGYIELDENSNSKVFKIKQKELIQNVDLNTAKNVIDLQLTKFGPYIANYSRNGRLINLYFHYKWLYCKDICFLLERKDI